LAIDQDFLATAEVANDTPVAYHSRRAIVSAGLERRFGPVLTAAIALQGTKANVVQLANNSITARSAPSTTRWPPCRST
jgi:hypothetical protein